LIPVTKPFLPPIEEYEEYLKGIWERNWITNAGPLVRELEQKLKDYFGVKHFFFVSNGTVAIQIAIKALGIKDEIITTPFSYVATTSTISWESCTPVFADIDKDTLCIDPKKIEEAVTPRTAAILATHVYGNNCAVEEIEAIAERHGIKVIYDAAHSFGVKYKGESVLRYGDISTLSFHATKLFHTGEGGAVITNDDEAAHKISYLRNFGHKGYEDFWGVGINGKNSELHAAMGLAVFPYVDEIIERRKFAAGCYDKYLAAPLSSGSLRKPLISKDLLYNFAYYPVIFRSEEELLKVRAALEKEEIIPRRYFYPVLSGLNYVSAGKMDIADEISRAVLCLPVYHSLKEDEIKKISSIITGSLGG
jgi:dTDP-4-amino-4,6-dideoxygalactose transaminase